MRPKPQTLNRRAVIPHVVVEVEAGSEKVSHGLAVCAGVGADFPSSPYKVGNDCQKDPDFDPKGCTSPAATCKAAVWTCDEDPKAMGLPTRCFGPAEHEEPEGSCEVSVKHVGYVHEHQ
jgi:hypothetical protein